MTSPLQVAEDSLAADQMTPEQIIAAAAPQQAPGVPVEAVMQSIQQERLAPGTIFEQFGNTIFIAHPDEKGAAVFRALNADTPRNYIEGTYAFFQQLKQKGFRTLVTYFKDPAIINVAKGVDRLYSTDAAMGFQVAKTSDGGFRMVVDLGGNAP